MSKDKLFADGAKFVNGLGGMFACAKNELDTAMKNKLLAQLHEIGYVPREDFEIMRELAQKAYSKVLELEKRIEALEGKK